MQLVNFQKCGLILFAITILIACNNDADSSDDYRDSLRQDSINRANNSGNDSLEMAQKDSRWVSDVLESNYAEIEMAKQAQQKATSKEVKDLAMMLEKDHMALVDEAKALASRKNWEVASAETEDARKKREDMMDDDVAKYQKDWLEMMEDNHERGIKNFEDASDDVGDADLRSWILNTIPKLKAHHDKIMQVQKNNK
jgi:putative membrane protein